MTESYGEEYPRDSQSDSVVGNRPPKGPRPRFVHGVVLGVLLAFLSCSPSSPEILRIRIPLEVEVSLPNPRNHQDQEFLQVSTQIYETLVSVDTDGRIVPALASSWEFDSEALYLELRRGVLFHNREEVTSSQVVSSLSNLQEESPILVPEAQGAYRVRIPLTSIGSRLLFLLSSPRFSIYSPESFSGTGPFRVSELSTLGALILEKNPHYWIQGMPIVDILEFYGSIQKSSQLQGFLNKDFDLLEVHSSEERAVLRASGLSRLEVFGDRVFGVALNLRNISIVPSLGTYNFRRVFLVQDTGILP